MVRPSSFNILLFLFLFNMTTSWAQKDPYDSGGALMPEQAAYDVFFYDLDLAIHPSNKSIEGKLRMDAAIVHPTNWMVLDLDQALEVKATYVIDSSEKKVEKTFNRVEGRIWIPLTQTQQVGSKISILIEYAGTPRVAPRPPWDGGFTWSKTPSGADWIATTCQGNGADLWWPCKDHVSDKPDSMALHIRVPDPLIVATNGRQQSVDKNKDGTSTYHWFVSTPISSYNIALNIAPYKMIEDEMTSVAGDKFPVVFYVLPSDYEKGEKLFIQILEHLKFYEKHFGPYPFRADKYGVAQTPHLGMEHQTIIAYGAKFSNTSMTGKDWGFDALHHHELAHEWWGNLVTNFDWKDMWIHEGFGSYMQALYVEELKGKKAYQDFMKGNRRFSNYLPIAPREIQTAKQIYRAPIYTKGAWVLHTLRFVIGNEAFFKALRRMAYPDPAMEKITDGAQVRFAGTDDFLQIAEEESGKNLDWFFELYLRQPKLPVLHFKKTGSQLNLKWESPNNLPFPMPIEISINKKRRIVDIPLEGITLDIGETPEFSIDPDHWILKNFGKEK